MEFKDYYQIMGVPRTVSADELRRAYRKLARKYHPDVSKEANAEAKFKEIGEAYEVLKDPQKRAAYDQLGAGWRAGQDFRPPPNWESQFGFHPQGSPFEGMKDSGFSDFFESLFGSARGPGRGGFHASGGRGKGEDHSAKIKISLEDAYHGGTRAIQLQAPEAGNTGAVRTLNVKIPKGITAGQKIRLAGQGAAGVGGGERGDLYLEIEFQPHRLYTVDGRDVYMTLPITPWEAALGATVAMPTLGGEVEMKIPPNAQSGARLRLKGRGLPGKPPGDQLVQLQIMTPPAETETARTFYRNMAEQMPYDPRKDLSR